MVKKFIESLKNANLKDYLSIPFWSWNDKLEPEELKREIAWMKENGIGGFFMHARSGLATEYLSDEWFECIKECADEAEKLDMDAWAYDENGWPSGFAGGKLLENEEDRDCFIRYTEGKFDKNATVSYLIEGDKLVRTENGDIGEYLNLFIETATSTVDILNGDVVRRFLELTHEEYKKHFGDDFSKKIKGFFTDEPQYFRWNTSYSRMLPEYFKKNYGVDIFDELGLLILKKNGYKQFRYRYWKAMQTLMLKNFAKQLYDWCDNNGVQLTGHYAQEDNLGLQMTTNAGVMPFYQYEHIPGVDWLGRDTKNEIPFKQLSSACEQLGKKLVLSETFGCCGWEITPADLGRILGYQLVNGINLFCQHLIPCAEHGCRKRDFPAHFSPVNPWVKENFQLFNITFSRLGYLLAESKKKVNVAVLHPIRSAYFDYSRDLEFTDAFGIKELEEGFFNTCDMLSRHNINYHFIDETLLSQFGFVNGNKIGCKNGEYEYLVIPPIITMDKTTEKLINDYVLSGGKVLLMGNKPTLLEAEPYDYNYLETNTSFEDIINSQPYKVKNTHTKLVSVMGEYDGTPFIFVQNSSDSEAFKQTFVLDDNVKSFVKIDPTTFETEKLPLTVTFEKNEFALLVPSNEEYIKDKELTDYVLRFSNADAKFDRNALTLDFVRFSIDGKNYSKPYYTCALYEKLVKEKFDGKLYLKYEFDVEILADDINIFAEEYSVNNACLNGKPLKFEALDGWNRHFYSANIKDLVHIGTNEYITEFDWEYNENVYLALFGENVTESLKNSLSSKPEIEPIYVYGKFGVFAKDGFTESNHIDFVAAEKFYIGKAPQKLSEPVTEGLPFFYGTLKLSQTFKFTDKNIRLVIDGNYLTAKLKINGKFVKNLLFEKYVDISNYIEFGDNLVEVEFIISLLNTFGPHHRNEEKYVSVSPMAFEIGNWNDDKSDYFHKEYDFLKLYS